MSDKWKKILGAVAPTLATAFGGPLAGAAVSALSRAVLNKDDGTEDEIAQAVASGNPEILLKLKEADNTFKLEMQRLGVDLEKLHSQDRDSARKRETSLGGWSNQILAGIIIGGFMAMVAYIIAKGLNIPPDQAALIGTLIGYVSAKADQVVSYYFGSSSGSVQKNAMIDKMMGK